jgi:hypothetical protein
VQRAHARRRLLVEGLLQQGSDVQGDAHRDIMPAIVILRAPPLMEDTR